MESISFKNLFDYLRRTKSAIVMPRLLREEILAKHWSLIETQGKKAAHAVSSLNRLGTDATFEDHLPVPDKKVERRDLMKKLRAPAKHSPSFSLAPIIATNMFHVKPISLIL